MVHAHVRMHMCCMSDAINQIKKCIGKMQQLLTAEAVPSGRLVGNHNSCSLQPTCSAHHHAALHI
jgi:hypothetical protein